VLTNISHKNRPNTDAEKLRRIFAFHSTSTGPFVSLCHCLVETKRGVFPAKIEFDGVRASFAVSRRAKSVGRLIQSPTSRLSAGYREAKARLHNQTKNVKISLSAVVRWVRTSKSPEKIYEKS
jgi:hypothetical protein